MVAAVLKKFLTPPDINLQVTDMVRVAVDNALKQLKANGGGAVAAPRGYQHPARTADEVRASVSDEGQVPARQEAVTDGMADDLADIVNRIDVHGEPQKLEPAKDIVIPTKGPDGWAF